VTRRPISLILDTSAIVAFTNESIDVGETIAEARDNGALIGLPVVCLVKSGRAVRDHDRLHYLVSDPATRVLKCRRAHWQPMTEAYDQIGRVDAASAAVSAFEFGAYILSGVPDVYRHLDDGGDSVIPIG